MELTEIVVLVAGIVLISLIGWYFLLSEEPATVARVAASGVQRARIVVKGAYEPSVVEFSSKSPAEIEFDRQEADSCTDTVVFSDLGIAQPLPAFKSTVVFLGTLAAGKYAFHCSMDMVRGTVIVTDES